MVNGATFQRKNPGSNYGEQNMKPSEDWEDDPEAADAYEDDEYDAWDDDVDEEQYQDDDAYRDGVDDARSELSAVAKEYEDYDPPED